MRIVEKVSLNLGGDIIKTNDTMIYSDYNLKKGEIEIYIHEKLAKEIYRKALKVKDKVILDEAIDIIKKAIK